MKNIFFPILLLTIILSSSGSYADNKEDNQYYQKMETLIHTQDATTVLEEGERLLRASPEAQIGVIQWFGDYTVDFIDKKTKEPRKDISLFNSLYFIAYSDFMFSAAQAVKQAGATEDYLRLTTESLLALNEYEVLVKNDAARCKDVSVQAPLQKTIDFRERRLQYAYELVPMNTRLNIVMDAMKTEEILAKRPPNREVCSSGIAKTADLLQRKDVKLKEQPINPNAFGSKAVNAKSIAIEAPKDYKYQPEYLDDKAWNKKRNSVRKALEMKLISKATLGK